MALTCVTTEAFANCLTMYAQEYKFVSPRTVLWGHVERVGPMENDDVLGDLPHLTNGERADDGTREVIILPTPSMSMEELLLPPTNCDVNQMGPTAMAYIGDVVFELFVRSRHVWPARRTADLQQQVVALVRAEYQSRLLSLLLETFPLTKKELQVLSRGRNAAAATRNRRDAAAYQNATALEALIGYLYISDRKRCEELLNWMHVNLDKAN